MKNKLAAVLRITIVLFVSAALEMQYDAFAHKVERAASQRAARVAA
jgi:hypothetical protein